jgi:spore germination protein YaaH
MSMTRRGSFPLTLLVAVLGCVLATSCGVSPTPPGDVATPAVTGSADAMGEVARTPGPPPAHELYGYVPYWEMDDTIADHLAATPLTTLCLFSVTDTANGTLNTTQTGYKRITGVPGTAVIREAHDRHVRVEVVFSSFGKDRNLAFFADEARRAATITALVALVTEIGLDGVNVDMEGLDPLAVPAYGAFVQQLRAAVTAADPGDRVTAATQANALGAAMAAAAVAGGAHRVFMMGYDYRVAGSSPGATSPLDRRDGERDLGWSIELYAAAGVPPDRTLLGLPLYGMTWPVAGPVMGAPETGRGEAWIPRRHLDLLLDPEADPVRDEQEQVEVYFLASDGLVGPPSPGESAPATDRTWEAVYVDSPATLAPKLDLANARGFAGAGFWAIGYERGLPGYTDLMARFVAGAVLAGP